MRDFLGNRGGVEIGPEWIETTRRAAEMFGISSSVVKEWSATGKIETRPKDASKPVSRHNPYLINRQSLEDALIERAMHSDPWPDRSVQEIVKPVPVLYSTNHLRSDQLGNVGEHLVAYYLSFTGASVSLVDRRGMDHFVRLTNGAMFALEVKTTSKPTREKGAYCRYTTQRLDADWFALLDLSTNIFLLRHRDELRGSTESECIPHKFFTPFYMNQSIQQLFEYYGAKPDPVMT